MIYMKKILSFSLICATALGFTGCSGEEDDLFNASAAERLNAASALYSARLTAQPNGWAMQYYPTYDDEEPNGAGYLILCRFNKDFSVDVSGYNWPQWIQQYNTEDRSYEWKPSYFQEYVEDKSYWEVITDNGPVLTFNSYNKAMHYFSDPDFRETGTGFGGDYEFIITDAPDDASYMILKGKKRGTYNLLTPVEEGIEYQSYLAEIRDFQSLLFSPENPTSCFLIAGDSTYIMEDAAGGLPSIYLEGTDKITNQNFNPFLITKRGDDFYLRFRDAFERDDLEGTLQDLRYVPEEDCFICTENDNFRIVPHKAFDFFKKSFENEHSFTLKQDAPADEMSDKMRQLMNSCLNGIKAVNKSYVFNEVKMRYTPSIGVVWTFKYQTTSSAREMQYEYSNEWGDGSFKQVFQKPSTDYAKNIAARVESIGELFENTLSQEFKISAVKTQFNLSKIKFTSVSDPELWFVLNY